LSQFNQI